MSNKIYKITYLIVHITILIFAWYISTIFYNQISANFNLTFDQSLEYLIPYSFAVLISIVVFVAIIVGFTNFPFWLAPAITARFNHGLFLLWLSYYKNEEERKIIYNKWQKNIMLVFVFVSFFILSFLYLFIKNSNPEFRQSQPEMIFALFLLFGSGIIMLFANYLLSSWQKKQGFDYNQSIRDPNFNNFDTKILKK